MNTWRKGGREKKRKNKKQKEEITEEKKWKEYLYCSSIFTLDSFFSSSLMVFHVFCLFFSCFNFHSFMFVSFL
jgi:hypothetical protein